MPDTSTAFCDVWAFIPRHLYNPPVPLSLLGNADIIGDSTPNAGSDEGVQITFKLLSVDPANYDDAPSEGLRRLLQIVHKKEIPRGHEYDSSVFGKFCHLIAASTSRYLCAG